jgi:predicted amidohydrolase
MKNIKFAVLQLTCSEDVQANQQKTEAKIREAAAQGAQVICLQELYQSVYFCHKQDAAYFDLAEVIPGPGTDSLLALAQELKLVIVASLFEKRSKGVITIPVPFWIMPKGTWASIEKCIFHRMPGMKKNTISLRAIWDTKSLIQVMGN